MSESKCEHAWSDDHICEACGSIRYASAPMWAVMAGISSGPRSVWLAIWISADRDTTTPRPVFTGNKRLAARAGGLSTRSVQRHLESLASEGWIRITDRVTDRGTRREIDLAWGGPREDWAAECKAKATSVDKSVAPHDNIVAGGESNSATDLSPNLPVLSPDATILSLPPDDIVAPSTLGGCIGNALDDLHLSSPRSEPSGQVEFALTTQGGVVGPVSSAADRPTQVLDYLNSVKAALRARLGIRVASAHNMTPKVRKWIADRIKDLGGGDIGVSACKRVIDVQAKDAERAGKDTEANGWRYLGVDMFSFDDAFARKLELWREDGEHRSFGYATARRGERPARTDHRSRGSSMPGQNERLAEAADRDNAERERMEAELQAHLAKIRGPNYVPPPPRVDEDEECTF
jgi:hypothetical protein